MKSFARGFFALIAISLLLFMAGCGSSGGDGAVPQELTDAVGDSPDDSSTGDTTDGDTTGGDTTPTPTTTVGPPASITLVSSPSSGETVSQGGEAIIKATVRDSQGNLVEDGTLVNFTSDKGTVTTSDVTAGGVAQATFQAGSTGGTVVITSTSGNASNSLTLQIATGTANSIVTESIEPSMVGVSGSGINDTALITFQVRDASGNEAPDGTEVAFAIQNGVNGGESLSSTTGTTAGGRVTVSLQAGDVAGTVSVLASFLNDDGVTVSTVASVTIVRNRPDAERVTLGAETLNIAGGDIRGLQTTIRAYLGDRAGNVVPDGTPVSFYSECGTIGDSNGFTTTSSFGIAEAVLQSSSPTTPDLDGLDTDDPPDGEGEGNVGLCRVMAATPARGLFGTTTVTGSSIPAWIPAPPHWTSPTSTPMTMVSMM